MNSELNKAIIKRLESFSQTVSLSRSINCGSCPLGDLEELNRSDTYVKILPEDLKDLNFSACSRRFFHLIVNDNQLAAKKLFEYCQSSSEQVLCCGFFMGIQVTRRNPHGVRGAGFPCRKIREILKMYFFIRDHSGIEYGVE